MESEKKAIVNEKEKLLEEQVAVLNLENARLKLNYKNLQNSNVFANLLSEAASWKTEYQLLKMAYESAQK